MLWLERMADAEMKSSRIFEPVANDAAIELEAEVEPDRADRRTVADAEADAPSQLAKIELRRPLEDVAAIDEKRGAEISPDRHAQLCVQQ